MAKYAMAHEIETSLDRNFLKRTDVQIKIADTTPKTKIKVVKQDCFLAKTKIKIEVGNFEIQPSR